MKLKQIKPNIYHVLFDNTTIMCKTMVRFSEYSENPFFKGKIFTLDEFKTWYKKHKGRQIYTFNRDWDGFNVQGRSVARFLAVETYPAEQAFIDLFSKVGISNLCNSYVITTAKDSQPTTFLHEYIHALFDINDSFRKASTRLINGCRDKKTINRWLKRHCYDKCVWTSECVAYITEDYRYLEKQCKLPEDSLKLLSVKLNRLYGKYK